MTEATPTLHLLCGKIAAGKSTLAQALAAPPASLLISEDEWLSQLYPGEIVTLADYVKRSRRLRGVVEEHVVALLRAGLSVVMDFPANRVETRQWLRTIFELAGSAHQLHFLDVADAVCLARLRQRNAAAVHAFAPSEAAYHEITGYFQPPKPDEGFNLVVHPAP